MKIAVFSKTTCPGSESLINHLLENDIEITLVIIEKKFRKKFTAKELKYKRVHQTFNQSINRNSVFSKIIKKVRKSLPLSIQAKLFEELHRIPFLKNRSIYHFCKKRNIPSYFVKNHSSQLTKQILERNEIDYVLLGSSNWLIKEPLLSEGNFQIINAHPGFLPKHRGLDSNLWAIKQNDPIGVTIYILDDGLDTGPILDFYELDLKNISSLKSYFKEISQLKNEAIVRTIKRLEKQYVEPKPQKNKYPAHVPMSLDELFEIQNQLKQKIL